MPENPTPEQKEKLLARAFDYAAWHLSQAAKTEKQLRDSLASKGYTEEYIDHAIAQCYEYHYLDDSHYAQMFVESRKNTYGKSRIKMDLQRKGIDKEEIDRIIEEEVDVDESREVALEFAYKRLAACRGLDRQKRVSRVSGALLRRGFDAGITFSVINEVLAQEQEDMIELDEIE